MSGSHGPVKQSFHFWPNRIPEHLHFYHLTCVQTNLLSMLQIQLSFLRSTNALYVRCQIQSLRNSSLQLPSDGTCFYLVHALHNPPLPTAILPTPASWNSRLRQAPGIQAL